MIWHATRLLSVLCLVETGVLGDARLCSFEMNGEAKYYVCPRNEHCCKVGCCLSPSFQFYQLWLYWLMVIFMLVVCSGGQWWYKYWVEGGREVASRGQVPLHRTPSSVPPPASRPHLVSAPSTSSPAAPPSFTLIHQICKPGLSHYHSRGDGKALSPYEQIYGPPPSYESVVGRAQLSSVLPSYSADPEPASSNSAGVGGSGAASVSSADPLGSTAAVQPMDSCPPYSQLEVVAEAASSSGTTDRLEVQQNEVNHERVDTSSSLQAESSPCHSVRSLADDTSPSHVDSSASTSAAVNSDSEPLDTSSPANDSSHCLHHQRH